ncbi:hypothetical protein AY601_0394 [Pedobacter cryoconitis]|uniref:Uncharacterized protein n=1 Tax=Pedobacter cryoconitis TaxID=188932 RepID=A0A127V7T3_9SPHI|nr:hypothetical protein [Pedobacter cryoconitis]AMP97356.1 hypothetical protein AY601_0394 [Pedobacter cryoconitis]
MAIIKSFTALLLLTFSIQAEAQYFKVSPIKETFEQSGEYDFPVLTGKTPAQNLINTFLQGKELDILPGKQKISIFENVRPKKGSNQGVTILTYEVLVNTPKLFSVEINSEYTSASLNTHSAINNFDSQTGRLIQFNDLVTKEGYEAIRQFIIKSRKTRLSSYLKSLKSSANKDESLITTYSSCLLEQDKDNLNLDDLKFQKNGLLLIRRSCSGSHYFQALEGKTDIYSNLLTHKFLEPYLNEYGKYLLAVTESKRIVPQSQVLRKGVFKGKINQLYPITLLVTYIGEDSFQASYFYDKYGKKTELRGTINQDSSLLLKEAPNYDVPKKPESFKLKIQKDGSLTGSWNDGKNTYPVELK